MTATVAGMRDILTAQTREVDACLHVLNEAENGRTALPQGNPDIARVIKPMIHMVGISGHSLLKLTEDIGLIVKDAYPVARGIIEGAVNVSYLMASDPENARRAERHAQVRTYRDLDRNAAMGGHHFRATYVGSLPPTEVTRLQAMLPEFTTSKGREKDWSNLSLRQRLDATAAAFPGTALVSLAASAFGIYRQASEVLHASYYGALSIWGLTVPNGTPASRDEWQLTFVDHQFSTLSAAIFAFAGMTECFAAYSGISQFKIAANNALTRLATLPAVADAMAPETGTNAQGVEHAP